MIRHGLKKAELGLPADQRKALIRTLVTEVLRHGRITTTKVGQPSSRNFSPYSVKKLTGCCICIHRKGPVFMRPGILPTSTGVHLHL